MNPGMIPRRNFMIHFKNLGLYHGWIFSWSSSLFSSLHRCRLRRFRLCIAKNMFSNSSSKDHLSFLILLLWKLKLLFLGPYKRRLIQQALNTVKLPHSFNRKNFAIEKISSWKANEMRMFFLYLGLPMLKHFMDAKFAWHLALLILGLLPVLFDVKLTKFQIYFIYKSQLIEYYITSILVTLKLT